MLTSAHKNAIILRLYAISKTASTDLFKSNLKLTLPPNYDILVKWIKKNIPRQEYFDGSKLSKGYIDNEFKDKYEYKYKLF